MVKNREILESLFKKGQIDLRKGEIFDYSPGPMPKGFDFTRIEGMMLGLAIGDALGNTTEGMIPGKRRSIFREIKGYLPNRVDNQPVGLPSDDSQLAFWTLEQMIADKGFIAEKSSFKVLPWEDLRYRGYRKDLYSQL